MACEVLSRWTEMEAESGGDMIPCLGSWGQEEAELRERCQAEGPCFSQGMRKEIYLPKIAARNRVG